MKIWRTKIGHLGLLVIVLSLLATPIAAMDPDRSPGRAGDGLLTDPTVVSDAGNNDVRADAAEKMGTAETIPASSPSDGVSGPELGYLPPGRYPGFYAARDNRNLSASEYNLVGGHQSFSWANLEPSEGDYQWDIIDNWITAQMAQGKQALGIGIVIYNGRKNLGNPSDPPLRVPEWVFSQKGARKIYCSGGLEIPRYWDSILQAEYEDFVTALAARYDNDPRIEFVQIGVGKYMETQPCDDSDDACVLAALQQDGWTQWTWPYIVNDIVDIYQRHFNNTKLLLLSEPTYMSEGMRSEWQRHAVDNGVGLQPAGVHADREWVDLRTKSGFHGVGKYDWMLDQAEETTFLNWSKVPMAHELYDYMIGGNTDLGVMPDPRQFFWAIGAALSRKVDYITIERNALYAGKHNDPVVIPFDAHIRIMGWAKDYIGKYVNETPSVWVLMRDTAYLPQYYPQNGNYSFWLFQDDDVPGGHTQVVTYRHENELYREGLGPSYVKSSIVTVDDEPTFWALANNDLSDPVDMYPSYKGWIARSTGQSGGNPRMYFKVDDRYYYGGPVDATITVTYFDRGTDNWSLMCHNAVGSPVTVQTVQKTNTKRWKTVAIAANGAYFTNMLTSSSDFYLDCGGDGDEIIHKVDFKVGGSSAQTQYINLTTSNGGWNFVSSRLVPLAPTLPEFLASIAGKYTLVQAYVNGAWKSYQPGYGGDLTQVDEKMGLWIQVSQNCVLSVLGNPPTSTSIHLSSANDGWNLIAWPSDDTRDVATALAGIAGSYDIVYGYHADDTGDPWKVYSSSAPSYANDLTHVGSGQALWVHVTADCDLVVGY